MPNKNHPSKYSISHAKKSKDLRELISKTRIKYDSIGRIWCPVLSDNVHFTSEGRIHLIYKGNRKKRPVQEQLYKLNLFPLAIPVLKTSKTIQSVRTSPNGKIQYYAITGKAGKSKASVRVIVKRTGDGQFNYHSIMLDNK